jgi:CheY-like chemotaxis protein
MNIYEQGILVVDDEDVVLALAKEELEGAGFTTVYTALSGIQCIDKLRQQGDEIVIILMDIRMPKMSGFDTVQHIMNHYDGVVGIIFHTAYEQYKDESYSFGNEHALNLDWFIKCPDYSELITSIKNNIPLVLEKRRKLISTNHKHLSRKLSDLKSDISLIRTELSYIEKKLPSFWADVGKQIIIIILLAIFVISFLLFGVPDLLKVLIDKL